MTLSEFLSRTPSPLLWLLSLPSRFRNSTSSTAPLLAAMATERFAFYLLIGCLVSWLGDAEGPPAYGKLVAACYLLPLLGGYVGGRLSMVGCAAAGAATLAAGYALCAAGAAQPIFALGSPDPATLRLGGLAVVAVGCGFFKPNLTTLVGIVSPPQQRARNYGRLYFAINLGSLPSTLVGAWLHARHGWAAAFGACAAAAALSATILLAARRRVRAYQPASADEAVALTLRQPLDPTFRPGALAVLLVGAAAFFACFYQQGTTLVLWAKQQLHTETPETLQTFNSVFVMALMLTPLAAWQSRLRLRCALSMLAMAAAFLVLALSPSLLAPSLLIAAWWFLAGSVSEGLLSPLGMDLAARMVPRRWAGVATAAWFCSIAAGGYFSGGLAALGVGAACWVSVALSLGGALWFALLGGILDGAPREVAAADGQRIRAVRPLKLAPGLHISAGAVVPARPLLGEWLHLRDGVEYVLPAGAVEVV